MKNETPHIGGKLRQLRRQRGLTQAELAKELEISASYLNLIEHNRRKITVGILLKLAQKFGLEINDLTEGDEARLSGDLLELFSDDVFGDIDLTNHDIREFANASPSVAKAVIHLYDSYRASHNSLNRAQSRIDEPLASEQVSDFLQRHSNYFASLEAVAARVLTDIGDSALSQDLLSAYLLNVFGYHVEVAAIEVGRNTKVDEIAQTLFVSNHLPQESRIFAIAKFIGQFAAESQIDTIVDAANFTHSTVESLARRALASYVAGAILMPYDDILQRAQDMRYDIERLSLAFQVSFEQICHRLTTLQKPGASGVPFHLIRTDIAGNVSKRFSMSGIQIPRHGGACPRWNVYEAFLSPGRITVQRSQMPDGQKFFCIARTLTKGENRHNATLRHMSIGLGCDQIHAEKMVYSEGMNMSDPSKLIPVGVNCRICPREDCTVRGLSNTVVKST